MSAPKPPVPARRLSPELAEALTEILADALVADLMQCPDPCAVRGAASEPGRGGREDPGAPSESS